MIVRPEGLSLVTFQPEGDFEYEWLMLNVDAEPFQWLGRTLVVEARLAPDVYEAVQHAGFVVDP